MRIGHGYDAHKFGGNRPLILGGVALDYPVGLLAHSDGDVVLHAICDALLGAIAKGDIGRHFSDTDSAYKNIDSRELLRRVIAMVDTAGFRVGNIDVTLVAQAPRVSHVVEAMCEVIALDLNVGRNQVNVKATTTEKMGFVGRKEGIACHAVVLLESHEK